MSMKGPPGARETPMVCIAIVICQEDTYVSAWMSCIVYRVAARAWVRALHGQAITPDRDDSWWRRHVDVEVCRFAESLSAPASFAHADRHLDARPSTG